MKINTVISVLLVLNFLLSTEFAIGQSSFLKEEQSGIGLAAFYNNGENYSGFVGSLGYSFAAKYDLGLVVGSTNFDTDVIGRNGNSTSFSPYATVTLLRPSKTNFLGVELSASYGYASYNSDEIESQNLSLSENGINAGGTLYTRLDAAPNLDVFLRLSLAYVKISQKFENSSGQSQTSTLDDIGSTVGIDFLFTDTVTASLDYSTFDGHNSYRIGMGVVIPTS